MRSYDHIRYWFPFPGDIPDLRVDYSRVPHPCATMHCCTVRLACLIHAASVRSEPGSNSPNNNFIRLTRLLMSDKFICAFFYFFRIHLCLKESSKPYSIESFASLSGQVRAIRTIQFFKEHQKLALLNIFYIFSFRSYCQLRSKAGNEFLI